MKSISRQTALVAVSTAAAIILVIVALATSPSESTPDVSQAAPAAKPALSVAVTTLQPLRLPVRIHANGDIMPWQEASIGTEADGLRLAEVKVNVGDQVRRNQLLATFAPDTPGAELAQSQAATAEARAALVEAEANAKRARLLEVDGAMSAQQITQYLVAERTAQARLKSAEATEQLRRLRLVHTQVLAPDDGVISSRTATVGAVLPAGQELFRLIRGQRLEWRAEVAAADLARLKPGQVARVRLADGQVAQGTLRMIAPTVDTQTRNGMAYVDLPAGGVARAGMFARGEFEVGADRTMTLPQSAVLLSDGFSYVLRVGPDARVMRSKVSVGRSVGERIEIIHGLDPASPVVLAGGGFLNEGDHVRVVEALPAPDPDQVTSSSRVGAGSLRLPESQP